MTTRSVLLFLGLLTSGLTAGLFFGWAVSVIPGTKRVDDRTYVTTMRSINRAIVNPRFLLAFLGTAVVLAAAAVVHFRAGHTRGGWWLTVATVTYVVGVLGVTVGGNIPLNNALEAFDPEGATDEELGVARETYEVPWNRWHNVRTVANVLTLSFTAVAALTTVDD